MDCRKTADTDELTFRCLLDDISNQHLNLVLLNAVASWWFFSSSDTTLLWGAVRGLLCLAPVVIVLLSRRTNIQSGQ